MREIAVDTETTGFNADASDNPDRIVEIGCIELENQLPTGREFHCYINPERDMPESAFAVHGLSKQFLSDKSTFSQIVDSFLSFIGDAPLVIHNASFDMRFINAELKRTHLTPIPLTRAIDTLTMARSKFPGQSASLDALCKRFDIDLSKREKHGALLDAKLLAKIYVELTGGKQTKLSFNTQALDTSTSLHTTQTVNVKDLPPRDFSPSKDEIKAHGRFIKEIPQALWLQDD